MVTKRSSPVRRIKASRKIKATATCPSNAPAPSWMLLSAFVIMVLLSVTLIYQYLIVPSGRALKAQEGFKSKGKRRPESFDVPSGSGKGASEKPPKSSLVFLYMNGCGWCDKFKPHWDEFESTYGASLATKGVEIVSYERSDPKAKQYSDHVQGYPTVLLVNSSVTVFQGERTSEGLAEFMQQNGISMSKA